MAGGASGWPCRRRQSVVPAHQPGGTMYRKAISLVALASLGAVIACSTHPAVTARDPPLAAPAAPRAPAVAAPEGLARTVALALADSAFRTYVKAQLDASPFREHKLPFQRFLAANGDRAAAALAQTARATPAAMRRAADAAIPLEFYLPVPAHRAAWAGDERVLVATAIGDHDAPVAFDPQGHRLVLSPAEPPATPVLALVPVETDFSVPPPALPPAALTVCWDYCPQPYQPPPPPPPPPSPGLYMTQAHFTQTFEGDRKSVV